MEFVDSHCHLNFHSYEQDIHAVLDRAAESGVNHIVVPGLDLKTSREALELATRFEPVYAAIGVHPDEADNFREQDSYAFEELLRHPKVVAVGEVGLDYYHKQDNKEKQWHTLQFFIDLSRMYHLPLILHSRESLSDLMMILFDSSSTAPAVELRGVFHAFEGNLTDAAKVIKNGFFIGAGGPITYKNASTKHEVFSKINLNHFVLETDGPFLSPQRVRGTRNEPANIPIIAERLAELQQCDIKVIADRTTSNAKKIFNWNN